MDSQLYVEHRTSRSAKVKKKWYKGLADYMLGQIDTSHVQSINDRKLAVDGEISDSYYKKVLNPFNSVDPKFTRYRADMRNYDLMKDIIRRYMGEFVKQPFDYQVKVNDADVITRFNDAFAGKIAEIAIQHYINMLNAAGVETGQQTQDVPDFQDFFDDFKKTYVDDLAIQGQDLLTAIIDWTESNLKYYQAFYNFIVLGQAYIYRDVRNNEIYKEVIDPTSYFPISNGKSFVEDHNSGIRKFKVTVPELLENFGDVIDDKTYKKVKTLFENNKTSSGIVKVPLDIFKSKLDEQTYASFYNHGVSNRLIEDKVYRFTDNAAMVQGHHFVFTTEVKVGHLVYLDPITGQLQEEIIEADSFELDEAAGHISIEWQWWNEVWEFYMFGTEFDDIFTVPRPIAYQRRDNNNPQKVKLPYNGISEVIPGTGFTFSIPDTILPFQIARNIFAFYREKIIGKNKDRVIVMPESLWGSDESHEDKLYRLEANSVLTYDDSDDDTGSKGQSIRVLDASLSQFIGHISDLMEAMKQEAWDTVDMNQQRYGDIQTSAGKGTTEEAIVRSSMGSVIIFTMFEKLLEKEYTADLEYSKAAYIDGKQGSYSDLNGDTKFLELDTEKHILSNYGLHVVNSVIQSEKKQKLENLAHAAAQNGEFKLGVDAIMNDNVASIKRAFEDFEKSQRQYQQSIATEKEQLRVKEAEIKEATAQKDRDSNIEETMIKEEAETERAILNARVKLLELEEQLIGGVDNGASADNINDIKSRIESEKLNLARIKQQFDEKKHKDEIKVKREDIKAKKEIAKENKNRYDVKK